MKKTFFLFLSVLLSLTLISVSQAYAQEQNLFHAVSISPGIGFEYFTRTINWDDEHTSKLRYRFITLDMEVELQRGIFIRAVLGYSSSNYDALTFRELPISVVIGRDVGYIKGYIFGASVKKSLVQSEELKIDASGEFFYCIGSKNAWEFPPDFVVEGSVEGRPTWMRASIGPVFTYTGFESIYPYLYLNFNKLWGKFRMEETIEDLTGTENQKIYGESSICIGLGFTFKLTESLSFKPEVNFFPYKDGVDSGIMIRAIYTFY
jgi:hypothetical protein